MINPAAREGADRREHPADAVADAVRGGRVRSFARDERQLGELSHPSFPRRAGDPHRYRRSAAAGTASRRWRGVGHPGPAALANAVFDASGVRLTTVPFTRERVRAAFGSATAVHWSAWLRPRPNVARDSELPNWIPAFAGTTTQRLMHARQILVDEGNGHAAFAHTRGHAFDRAMAHIAGGEDAGHAGFQQVRIALQRPQPCAFATRSITSRPVQTYPSRRRSRRAAATPFPHRRRSARTPRTRAPWSRSRCRGFQRRSLRAAARLRRE